MIGRDQARAVVLAALLVVSTFSMVGVGAAHEGHDDQTFTVTQNGECYEVSAIGDGTEAVEDFYDYRNPETEPSSFNYASYGTKHLQSNQESKLFFYHGENGYSMVVLHDQFSEEDEEVDGSHASTVTFTLSGMPSDGEWIIQDDYYENDNQDDNWDIDGTTHEIDWMWADDRNDGGVFLGVEDAEITIDPGFNGEANQWGDWPHSNNPEDRMTAWSLIDEDESETELDSMSDPITIEQGECSEEDADPTADFSIVENPVANDETVEFDAGSSSDDGEIVSYDWDLGDGTEAAGETTSHTYDGPGDYTVTLTVTDDAGNTDTATQTVTVEDGSPTVEGFDVTSANHDTVEVGFYGSESITDIEVEVTDEDGTPVETLTEDDFTESDGGDYVWYGAAANAEPSASYAATLLKAADEDGNDAADGQTGKTYVGPVDGDIEYVNATTVEVTGEFEQVWVQEKWYNKFGPATDYYDVRDVSGTTIITADPEGALNGTAIQDIAAAKHANDGEHDLQKKNPYRNASQPYSLNLSVASVTETGDGVYDVTFEYANPNDGEMIVENSEFASGNVEGEPPETFAADENSFTTTWTPAANDERVTLEVNQSNFGLDDVSASTQSASEYGGVGENPPTDDGPTAALSLSDQTVDFTDKLGLDASASTDDGDIVEYRWKFGNGVERTTPDDANDKNPHEIWHKIYTIYDEPGTYTVSVTVVDDDGGTDTATKELTVEQNDGEKPEAKLHVPSEATVGEEVTLEATDFSEDPDDLAHICWVVGDDHDKPEGATATHTFEKTGEHTVELHIVDKAGNSNMQKATITVTEADDDPNDGSDDPKDDDPKDDEPEDDPVEDEPNKGSNGGGVPSANPPSDDSNDDETPKKAAFNGSDGNYGEIVLRSDATDTTVEVAESVPDEARQPTVALDGFEALTYAVVSADEEVEATFTVSKDRLESADADADAVSLFRFDDGSWNAVETELVEETDDAYEFAANATNGTYAIGVGAPSIAVEDLRVADDRVAPGDAVTVTVTVENDGHASGTQDVALTVDGETVAAESVTLDADSTSEIEFTRSFDAPGVYAVSAGDASAEIVVEGIETSETETTDLGTTTAAESDDDGANVPGFGVGAALVALAAAALLARRRA